MKKLITLVGLFAVAVSGTAQSDSARYTSKYLQPLSAENRISASLSMGTGIGFSRSTNSTLTTGTYIAPVVNYRFTPRFKLSMTLLHYTLNGNFFNPNRSEAIRFSGNPSYSGNQVQLEGHYLLNQKTVVSGGILYGGHSLSLKENYKGASLQLDYKLTPHTTFSVRTTVIQGNSRNALYNSPFGMNSFSPAGMQSGPFNMYTITPSPFNF